MPLQNYPKRARGWPCHFLLCRLMKNPCAALPPCCGDVFATLWWSGLSEPCGQFSITTSGPFNRKSFVFLLKVLFWNCSKAFAKRFWAPARSLCAWGAVEVCCLQRIFEKIKQQHDALILSSRGTDGRIVRLSNFNSSHLICRLNEYWAMLAWVRCNEYT